MPPAEVVSEAPTVGPVEKVREPEVESKPETPQTVVVPKPAETPAATPPDPPHNASVPKAEAPPKTRKDGDFPTWHVDSIMLSVSGVIKKHFFFWGLALKELLRAAARAQLSRMMAIKKKKTYLNPPEWLREAYNSRGKGEMADLLVDCNFSKDWVIYFKLPL